MNSLADSWELCPASAFSEVVSLLDSLQTIYDGSKYLKKDLCNNINEMYC